jgi:hypothetical protein
MTRFVETSGGRRLTLAGDNYTDEVYAVFQNVNILRTGLTTTVRYHLMYGMM